MAQEGIKNQNEYDFQNKKKVLQKISKEVILEGELEKEKVLLNIKKRS